jgi:EF hand
MEPLRPRLQRPERPARPPVWPGPLPARLLLFGGVWLLAAGCSGGVSVPPVSPAAVGAQALAEYDKNGDGFLDAGELERCPALKQSFKALDQDGDGRLSAREIADRVQSYLDSRVALTAVTCRVLLNNRPLEGVTVTFEPEKFMGPGVKPASGVTDSTGAARLQAEGEGFPGAHFGFYRVRISKKDGAGQETIPARYNTQTILGREIGPGKKKNKRRKDALDDDDNFTFLLSR